MKAIKAFCGILTITAAFCVGTPAHSQSFLTDGLVAYYPFNGNANDASGNGNNGIGGDYVLTSDRFGQPASAVAFNGQLSANRGIRVPTIPSLKDFPFTYSVWFNLRNPLPVATTRPWVPSMFMAIVGRGKVYSTSIGELAVTSTVDGPIANTLVYYTGGNQIRTSFQPSANEWYNVVFTLDSSRSATFYLNGMLIGSMELPWYPPIDFIADKSIPITIGDSTGGAMGDNPFYTWNGSIDDVRIYNRALTRQEVVDLYAYESHQPLPSVSTVVKTIEVTMHVVPRKTYQLQASLDLTIWKNVGNPFVAPTSTIVQDFDAIEVGQYFRIQELSANHHSSK